MELFWGRQNLENDEFSDRFLNFLYRILENAVTIDGFWVYFVV